MQHELDPGPAMTRRQRLRWAWTLVALMIGLAALMCTSCAAVPKPRGMTWLYRPAVTLLVMKSPDGDGGKCTAWKLDADLIATAGHCCEPDYEYTLVGEDAAPVNLYDDDLHDVCILRGHMAGAPIALASSDPEVGAPVWTAGYPKGWFLISSGHWAGRDHDDEGVCSVVVAGGASGSPVLDSDGRAVGVLVKRAVGMDNLTIVSPIEWLEMAHLVASRSSHTVPVRLTAAPAPEVDLDALLRDLDRILRELTPQ